MTRSIVIGGLIGLVVAFLCTTASAQVAEDVKEFPNCKYCGMDRQTFAHSRMLVEYDDGSSLGTCSIHCTAVDMALKIGKSPKANMVGDYKTKKLIDAQKASWIIGGKKPGVMTNNAKWAFDNQDDAQAFLKENGGRMGSFDDAMKTTFEDMYADVQMIRTKRAKMKQMEQEHKK
jgi:copper chaperone NosL